MARSVWTEVRWPRYAPPMCAPTQYLYLAAHRIFLLDTGKGIEAEAGERQKCVWTVEGEGMETHGAGRGQMTEAVP